jgi:hypothetical protein
MDFLARAEQISDQILLRFPHINDICEGISNKINNILSKQQVLVVISSLFFLILILFFGLNILSIIFCVLVPAVKSVRAIDQKSSQATDGYLHDTASFWLKYWIIFSTLNVLEIFLSSIILRIRYYNFLRIGFLFWCSNSKFKGSNTVYDFFSNLLKSGEIAPGEPIPQVPLEEQNNLNTYRMKVTIKQSTSLSLPQSSTNLSPYCVLELRPNSNRRLTKAEQAKFKTKCKENTQIPIWNETMTFQSIERLDASLVLTVYDKQTTKNDQMIGETVIGLDELDENEDEMNCDLLDPEKAFAGTIAFRVSLTPTFIAQNN